MLAQQESNNRLPTWPPDTTATQGLSDYYFQKAFPVDIDFGIMQGITVYLSEVFSIQPAFDWEAAEKRADWEEMHNRFAEFSNVKGLLTDLHS